MHLSRGSVSMIHNLQMSGQHKNMRLNLWLMYVNNEQDVFYLGIQYWSILVICSFMASVTGPTLTKEIGG